jgi:hypothetical protein
MISVRHMASGGFDVIDGLHRVICLQELRSQQFQGITYEKFSALYHCPSVDVYTTLSFWSQIWADVYNEDMPATVQRVLADVHDDYVPASLQRVPIYSWDSLT